MLERIWNHWLFWAAFFLINISGLILVIVSNWAVGWIVFHSVGTFCCLLVVIYEVHRALKRRAVAKAIREAEKAGLYEISEHLTSELDIWKDTANEDR